MNNEWNTNIGMSAVAKLIFYSFAFFVSKHLSPASDIDFAMYRHTPRLNQCRSQCVAFNL